MPGAARQTRCQLGYSKRGNQDPVQLFAQLRQHGILTPEFQVMANGRVAFIRTDNFFDRSKVETHLHSIRPDGTDGLAEFAASPGAGPRLVKDTGGG